MRFSKIYIFVLLFFMQLQFSFSDSLYTVKKGDTLYSISRKYEITVAELRAANNLSESDILKEGAKLTIPSADISNAAALSSNKTSEQKSSSAKKDTALYTVVKGDTLYGISRKYDIKVPELMAMNNLDSNSTLKIGQKLYVPSSDKNDKKSKEKNEDVDKILKNNIEKNEKNTASDIKVSSSVVWPLKNPIVKKVNGKVSGVQLTGNDSETVKCVREGTVMYTGVYRGFGEVIFVQSKTGLIYSYSGLGKVTVKKGDYVLFNTELGVTGKGNNSSIKFMVFQNGKPVNPVTAPRG